MPPHPPEASDGGPVSRRDGTPVVLLLGGDGIGPEVVEAAAACMQAAARRLGRAIRLEEAPIGGAALEMGLPPLPEPTLRMALDADAVLLGAVGGPRWDGLPGPQRPEAGLLELRRQLGVFANVRPVRMFAGLETTSPLRPEVVAGTDLVVVRELLGGLYYGPRGRRQGPGGPVVFDTLEYDQAQIDRAARFALEMARRRRRSLTLVDKANVLESSRMWRERVQALAPAYPDVAVSFQYVDSCAMRLVREPRAFDVLLCENMFGDILSDEAAVLAGSIGMLPSASLGGRVGLYEPVHGSAPDIAGRGVANPIGAILAGAMLLEWSLGWRDAAACIEAAVARVLADGWRTGDLVPAGGPAPGVSVVGTQALTDRILAAIEQSTPQEGVVGPVVSWYGANALTTGHRVLIVDDEPSIVELVRFTLEKEGFQCDVASDGPKALEMVERTKPDLVVLDLMLPGLDGLEVCRRIRQRASVPIVMLTAKASEVDKVVGLELGADDYVTKPFSPRELVARIRAVLRRFQAARETSQQADAGGELRVGDVIMDVARHQVWVKGRPVELTPKEYDLLRMLMSNKGIVLTRELLLDKVWGYDFAGDTRTVDVHVVRLRQKLEDDPAHPRYIETVRGVGYRMREHPA